jgi:hypothetical protein
VSLEDSVDALSAQIDEVLPRLIAALDNLAGVIEASPGGGVTPDEFAALERHLAEQAERLETDPAYDVDRDTDTGDDPPGR